MGDPDALEILEDAAERYAALEGFCADFRQVRQVPLLNQETRSHGRLCQMHPGYFRMDFQEPAGDQVVSDGEYVWVYFPSNDPGQVIRSTPQPGQQRFDFHREFLADPGQRYEPSLVGRDELDGYAVKVVDLVPRQRAAFERARLWIDVDGGLIRKVEVDEENESRRVVELENLDLQPGLSSADFEFEVPEGVRVMDR